MGLVVYNTLTRKKEPFTPVTPGKIGIYLCGPTVYKPSHVGHAVGPIIFDAVKRYLVHRGWDVTWVVNITDVDDKLIVEAANQGCTTFELAERVTADYLSAMAKLHVDTIDTMPKASEHIGDIIGIIRQLEAKDIAYASGGDVYFDVVKHHGYGKLSNRNVEDQEGQRALASGDKRNPGDFALWKAAKPDEPDEVKFDSPWGAGRPGWHIECSAMSQRYLGDTFDIHGGGMDLIFPHHENEIAQSEAATGKPFANVWMHNGLTRVNTKKISKSDASPEMQAALAKMTLHNLLDAYAPELIRFFVLSTQYRRPIEYSEQEIDSKRKGLDTFYRLFERVERLTGQSPYAVATEPLGGEGIEGSRDQGIKASGDADYLQNPDRKEGASNQNPDRKEGAYDQYPDREGGASNQNPDRKEGASNQNPDRKEGAGDQYPDREGGASNQNPDRQEGAYAAQLGHDALTAACAECLTAFHRAMDDDFNTAGAIAAMFDCAGAINRVIEQEKLESAGADATGSKAALAATGALIGTARLIGLFLDPQERKAIGDDGLTDQVMQILIDVRQQVRKKKDFETADLIRNRLAEAKVTLEDRPDGTVWRVE